ncbi:helix-turn-helix domain-containing protein, partial [Polaribacter sp. BAL334]|uniref:helix-turn-helix domain-containing protein n=1 Tax=Polaribacter sp. BAL334 TaxID=1708178 RepID=UPI0018D226D9
MDAKKVTQIHHHISDEDLVQSISKTIRDLFVDLSGKQQTKEQTIWITRNEVAKILSVSLVTVDDWTKRKILTAYRIANKKRFKRSEVESALTKIN